MSALSHVCLGNEIRASVGGSREDNCTCCEGKGRHGGLPIRIKFKEKVRTNAASKAATAWRWRLERPNGRSIRVRSIRRSLHHDAKTRVWIAKSLT